jgi:hypothetical protein
MREDGLERGFILGKTPGAERILLYDDMEGLLKWGAIEGAVCLSLARDSIAAYGGNYGIRFGSRCVVPNGPCWGWVGRYFPASPCKRFEVVALFRRPYVGASDHWGVSVYVYDGVHKFFVEVYGPYDFLGLGWHQIIVRFDLHSEVITYCRLDGEVQYWEGQPVYKVVDTSPVRAFIFLRTGTADTRIRSMYWDDVLVRAV